MTETYRTLQPVAGTAARTGVATAGRHPAARVSAPATAARRPKRGHVTVHLHRVSEDM
ncbi:hypothetical protein JOL79_26440 [Microbispora sp. RL4-1S]|uniref:Uncharacterized protein n=1 Tax=Microbispora oryzae TaxID=2806554 RepID=A0A940WQC0_9ACTN|nr:hypothetical protein [Microbispora oryzae]MBP2707328.1 hypothetical protein [Microbispora oryzae]